jgi:hypothetical protein
MHDSNSTAGPQRPRVRRGLGVLVGAALLVTPLAAAPAASAQGLSNVTPQGLAAVIAQLADFLAQIASGLASPTIPHPLGESAPNSVPTCSANYADGISSTLTCIISQLGPSQKAKIKATKTHGKVTSMRWAK